VPSDKMTAYMIVSLILLIGLLAPLPIAYVALRYRAWKVSQLRPARR
jgi:hypothetical protein